MVQYLSSSASKIITVLVSEIGTTLTIAAPSEVTPGESFEIYGQLTRNDTGEAIPNASISLSYNGNPLGSVTTDMQGVYGIPASLPSPGTFTVRADFAGMTVPGLTLGASSASRRIGLAAPSVLPLVLLGIAVIAILGR